MCLVTIANVVEFAPNVGVLVREEALSFTPERLHEYVTLAFQHIDDDVLRAALYYEGPLCGVCTISFEDYLPIANEYAKAIRIKAATATAKRILTRRRRTQYSAQRDAIALALIDQGTPYVCSWDGCQIAEDLTLDHIIALSRGGTDDLSNLRFLCRQHNSQKGSK